jgi:acyl-CoA synthetase (AMP-forming)/AMP-acid ligase II
VVGAGGEFTYVALLTAARALAARLAVQLGGPAVRSASVNHTAVGPRVAVMAAAGPEYVVATWATWIYGGVAVPLAIGNPTQELLYVLNDAQVTAAPKPLAWTSGSTLGRLGLGLCRAAAAAQ